jgi:hypothetical protein
VPDAALNLHKCTPQISSVAWDSVKERLVCTLSGDHELAGHALLFGTTQVPVLSAVCQGAIHLPHYMRASTSAGHGAGPMQERAVAMQTAHRTCTLVAAYSGAHRISVVPVAVLDAAIVGEPGSLRTPQTGLEGSQISSRMRVQLIG